ATVLLAAVLLTGILVGAVGDRIILVRQGRVLPREGLRVMTARIVRAMDHELDLTPDQRTRIEEILRHRPEEVEAVWAGLRPAARREIDRTNAEIRKTLNPDQQERFDLLVQRWERRTERILGRRGPWRTGAMRVGRGARGRGR